jgi:exopolyphosphatase/guanosine-5'-triphosphate,3'-diphosphate pyrophosphatase
VRRACIDIGSNTTRLLVADCDGDVLQEVHQERVFTRIGRGLGLDGEISHEKLREVSDVVAVQFLRARELGVDEIYAVATAAIRRAPNRAALAEQIRARCGLEVAILSGADEARLAFIGAARTLDHVPGATLGVVDVGGGSCEIVVGAAPDRVSWSSSFAIGSGDLADDFLRSDPPSGRQLSDARAHVVTALAGLDVPRPVEAVAVGGSATSLRRMVGPVLDADVFARSLRLLATERAIDVARRFGLDMERVRLLPAGLLILQAASELFGVALGISRGGIREGVLLQGGP